MENKTNMAAVNAKSVPISTKISVEMCNYIRNKNLKKVQRDLQKIMEYKKALPIKRYNMDLGHKPGMAAGSYPQKLTKYFLELLNSLEKNAENKGLNTTNLIVVHAKADKAERKWRAGRKGRAKAKNSHIELMVEESKGEKK